MKALSDGGFVHYRDYVIKSYNADTLTPYDEDNGPIMAELVGAIACDVFGPKAEVYYAASDNEVLVCGYAR
jgi:hypothetical protein